MNKTITLEEILNPLNIFLKWWEKCVPFFLSFTSKVRRQVHLKYLKALKNNAFDVRKKRKFIEIKLSMPFSELLSLLKVYRVWKPCKVWRMSCFIDFSFTWLEIDGRECNLKWKRKKKNKNMRVLLCAVQLARNFQGFLFLLSYQFN